MLPEGREEEILRAIRGIACIESLGLAVLALDEGSATISGKHDPNFDGVNGTFHGGLLATLADCTAWFAIATRTGVGAPLVTTDLNIHYHNPCVGTAIATGTLIKLGRTLCPVQVEIRDTEARLIATSRVCYMRMG